MKMSPIKKLVLALAAATIAITLVTANNLASIMLIVASKEANASSQQTVQTNNPVQNQTNNNTQGSSSNSTVNNSTSNNSTSSNTGTTSAPADTGSADNSASNNAADTDNKTEENNGSSAKLSDNEVIDMYKKAVNAARTSSSSVTRVKDGAINYKGIVEAGKLSSVASSLMGMFMASGPEAIEVKNEAWEKEKLPDASNLTAGSLDKISYEDKGDTYVVTLVAKSATNPVAGSDGVGSIAGVIEESQITGAIGSVPGLTLEGISIDYELVTSVATIDKATGNLVALNLDAPCILKIGYAKVPLLGEVNNAQVGIQVITEYAIAY